MARGVGQVFLQGRVKGLGQDPLTRQGGDALRAALHLEAGPIPLEADCMKFHLFLGWRPASTTHYNNKIITWDDFPICKGLRVQEARPIQ
jgi:hypothetical protein